MVNRGGSYVAIIVTRQWIILFHFTLRPSFVYWPRLASIFTREIVASSVYSGRARCLVKRASCRVVGSLWGYLSDRWPDSGPSRRWLAVESVVIVCNRNRIIDRSPFRPRTAPANASCKSRVPAVLADKKVIKSLPQLYRKIYASSGHPVFPRLTQTLVNTFRTGYRKIRLLYFCVDRIQVYWYSNNFYKLLFLDCRFLCIYRSPFYTLIGVLIL